MLEENPVSGAQVVQARLTVGGMQEAQAGTFAMTGFQPFANTALAGKGFFLELAKGGLLLAVHHLRQSVGKDITQLVLGEDKVVAAVNIAIMFHNDCVATLFGIDADARGNTHPTGKGRIEDIHEGFAYIMPYPFIENDAEEMAPLSRFYAKRGKGAIFVKELGKVATVGMLMDSFHHRTKL